MPLPSQLRLRTIAFLQQFGLTWLFNLISTYTVSVSGLYIRRARERQLNWVDGNLVEEKNQEESGYESA